MPKLYHHGKVLDVSRLLKAFFHKPMYLKSGVKTGLIVMKVEVLLRKQAREIGDGGCEECVFGLSKDFC
jgi:hypothetical protein